MQLARHSDGLRAFGPNKLIMVEGETKGNLDLITIDGYPSYSVRNDVPGGACRRHKAVRACELERS
jgi:hypothetical protein